jgi:hypothetical protein
MSNFYTEENKPLKRVRALTLQRDFITAPFVPDIVYSRPSPLSVVTKLVLGELEKPIMVHRNTSKRIKECKIKIEKESYV